MGIYKLTGNKNVSWQATRYLHHFYNYRCQCIVTRPPTCFLNWCCSSWKLKKKFVHCSSQKSEFHVMWLTSNKIGHCCNRQNLKNVWMSKPKVSSESLICTSSIFFSYFSECMHLFRNLKCATYKLLSACTVKILRQTKKYRNLVLFIVQYIFYLLLTSNAGTHFKKSD